MSRHGTTGTVVLYNPRGEDMADLEENPRRRRRRKKGKKSAKRAKSNPAPRRRRRRRATAHAGHAVAPRRRRRRRHSMRAHKVSRRRRTRRNPSFPKFMTVGACMLGGAVAYGADYLVAKIPISNVYAKIGLAAAAPAVIGVGAALAGFEHVSHGAFGVFGYKLPQAGLAAWNVYQAAKLGSIDDKKKEGQKGLGSVSPRTLPSGQRVVAGFAPMRRV